MGGGEIYTRTKHVETIISLEITGELSFSFGLTSLEYKTDKQLNSNEEDKGSLPCHESRSAKSEFLIMKYKKLN